MQTVPAQSRFIAINTPVARQFLEITLPNGLTADYKPIGAALLALPFYLVTHLIFLLVVPGHQDPDVSAEYQLAFTAASLFYAVLAMVPVGRTRADLAALTEASADAASRLDPLLRDGAATMRSFWVNASRVGDHTFTRFEYDGLGRQTKMIEAAGLDIARTTDMAYDLRDNLTMFRGGVYPVR